MTSLQKCHPANYAEFMKGNYTVKKILRCVFSAIDQDHSQNNTHLKVADDAIGINRISSSLESLGGIRIRDGTCD